MNRLMSMLFIALIFLFPVILLIVKSVSPQWRYGDLLPSGFDLRGWTVLWTDPLISQAILVSLQVAFLVILLNYLIATPVAKALAFYEFRGKDLIETVLFMPILIPSLAVAMGMHMTMIQMGLANSVLGVILVHLIPTIPYSIRILRAGYERMGMKWEEQAKSLGSSPFDILTRITIPLLFPSLRAATYLILMISLSQYVLTALIGGGNVITLALVYFPYFQTADDAVLASFSLLFALLPIGCLVGLEAIVKIIRYVR